MPTKHLLEKSSFSVFAAPQNLLLRCWTWRASPKNWRCMEPSFIPLLFCFRPHEWMMSLVLILKSASVPDPVNSIFEVSLMVYGSFFAGGMWSVNKKGGVPVLSWAFMGCLDLHESGKWLTEAPHGDHLACLLQFPTYCLPCGRRVRGGLWTVIFCKKKRYSFADKSTSRGLKISKISPLHLLCGRNKLLCLQVLQRKWQSLEHSFMSALSLIDTYSLPPSSYRAEIKCHRSVDKQYGQAGIYLSYTVVLNFLIVLAHFTCYRRYPSRLSLEVYQQCSYLVNN